MTALTLGPREVLQVLGPVRQWTAIDHPMEPLNFVRLIRAGGWVYAIAANGRAAVMARVPTTVSGPEVQHMLHRDHADRLVELSHPAEGTRSIEISGDDRRVLLSIVHEDFATTLIETHTIPPVANATFQKAIGPMGDGNVGPVNLSADDLVKLGRSLAYLQTPDRLGAAGATVISTTENRQGWCIATHTDRFLALIPATAGDHVPGTGLTRLPGGGKRGTGPVIVNPLTTWPDVLTDTGL